MQIFNPRKKFNFQENLNFSIKSKNKMSSHHEKWNWKTFETYWLRPKQKFGGRQCFLKGASTHQSKIKEPNLFLENKVIRCQKRLENAHLDYNIKYPILLPAAHTFTKMLLQQIHWDHGHPGVSQIVFYKATMVVS